MCEGVDVHTSAWHGAGSEGMLGCSPGAGGKRDVVGLMGGNPGEVCLSRCCGAAAAPDVLAYASLAISSGSLVGVGASGRAASESMVGRGFAREAFESERSSAGGAGVKSASGLRCAAALKQASEVRPTMAGERRVHLLSGPRDVSRMMLVLLRIRTKIMDDTSRRSIDFAGRPDAVSQA